MGLLQWIRSRRPGPLPDTLTPGTTERVAAPHAVPPPALVEALAAASAAAPEVAAAYLYDVRGLAEDEAWHLAAGVQLDGELDYGRVEALLEALGSAAGDHELTAQVLADELLYEVQAVVPPFYERA